MGTDYTLPLELIYVTKLVDLIKAKLVFNTHIQTINGWVRLFYKVHRNLVDCYTLSEMWATILNRNESQFQTFMFEGNTEYSSRR